MNKFNSGGRKILVVEDEPAIGIVCRRVLTREGFVVDIAANGKIAQHLIEEKQYDLCLLDLKTPLMSGQELFQWLKGKQPQLANKVIFTTGDISSRDTQQFLEQAARPFLHKPFSPEELRTVVRKVLP